MDSAAQQRPSAFSIWLRTGRWPAPAGEDVERKFNPWHDPANGQFTSGPGGGSFGGGGATGRWSAVQQSTPRVVPSGKGKIAGSGSAAIATGTADKVSASSVPQAPATDISARSQAARTVPAEPKLQTVVKNGYEYRIDGEDRTREVSGTITLNNAQTRSRAAQTNAGGSDRLDSDDGGHYIARRFNGPTDAFNHFAQDANFNRGEYRSLEDSWAKATAKGDKVVVRITPLYSGASKRPSTLNIRYSIGKRFFTRIVPNGAKGKSNGDG